jgi:hypothetical protein
MSKGGIASLNLFYKWIEYIHSSIVVRHSSLVLSLLGAGYWVLGIGCWVLDAGYSMLDTGYWLLGYWILVAGVWVLVPLHLYETRPKWHGFSMIKLTALMAGPGLNSKQIERRTSNVQHRTSNIDDATLYLILNKRIAPCNEPFGKLRA